MRLLSLGVLPLLQHTVHLPRELMEQSHVIHEIPFYHLVHTLASLHGCHPTTVHVLKVCCDPPFVQVIETSNGLALIEAVLCHQILPHILELKQMVYDGNQMILPPTVLRV